GNLTKAQVETRGLNLVASEVHRRKDRSRPGQFADQAVGKNPLVSCCEGERHSGRVGFGDVDLVDACTGDALAFAVTKGTTSPATVNGTELLCTERHTIRAPP